MDTAIDLDADEEEQLMDFFAAALGEAGDELVLGDDLFSQFAGAMDLPGALALDLFAEPSPGPEPQPGPEPAPSPAADADINDVDVNVTLPLTSTLPPATVTVTVDKEVPIAIPDFNNAEAEGNPAPLPDSLSVPITTDKPPPTPTPKPKPTVVEDSSMFALVLKEIQSNEKNRAIAKAAAVAVAAAAGHDSMPLCFRNTTTDDYVKNRRRFGLKTCSVIVFDVLKLTDKVLHRNDSRNLASSLFPNMRRILINNSGIKDMHRLEGSRRVYYRKKLNRALRRGTFGKVKGSSSGGGGGKVKVEGGHHQHKEDGYKTQLQLEHERKKKLEELKGKKKAEKFSAGGTRILDFERRHGHHDSSSTQQQIKRPKMKETETTSKPGKNSQYHSTLQAVKHAPPPASFRIPKRENLLPRTPLIITSTPLASYAAPRETMRFQRERFRKETAAAPFQNKWTTDFKAHKWDFKQEVEHHSEPEADFDEDCQEDTPPPPISEVDFGQLVEGVTKVLAAGVDGTEAAGVDLNLPPSAEDNSSDFLAQKYAWWFRTMEKDPVGQLSFVNPELEDGPPPEAKSGYSSNGYTGSSIGNVSNPGGGDDGTSESGGQQDEITYSENQNPAITDEFCGCQLLGSKYRISADLADGADGEFAPIFLVRPGSNYEKESFQAKCNICNELVNGKGQLGPHVRSTKHRESMKNLSLQLIRKPNAADKQANSKKSVGHAEPAAVAADKDKQSAEITQPQTYAQARAARAASKMPRRNSKGSNSTLKWRIANRKPIKVKLTPEFSPTNSRSPLFASSPSRRPDRGSLGLGLELDDTSPAGSGPSRSRSGSESPYDPFTNVCSVRSRSPSPVQADKKANEVLRGRLISIGKWNPEFDHKWTQMERDESALWSRFVHDRRRVLARLDDHPKYTSEWKEFWERKSQKILAAGQDPTNYDYVPEWKAFWSKRVKVLIDAEYAAEVDAIRRKYGLDTSALERIVPKAAVAVLDAQEQVQAQAQAPVPAPDPALQIQISDPDRDVDARSMSMSISDGEEGQGQGQVKGQPRVPVPVTIQDVKSTWEAMTGLGGKHSGAAPAQPQVQEPTPSTSANANALARNPEEEGSEPEQEFDGFDLVQVLQLILGLEDKLRSRSASASASELDLRLVARVRAAHRTAEELELSSAKRSNILLESADFVSLLHAVRDRFDGLIHANILPTGTMQSLNFSVYMLNMVLGTATCQRVNLQARLNRPDDGLTLEQKRGIVNLLAGNLLAAGNVVGGELELEAYVYSVLSALALVKNQSAPGPGPALRGTPTATAHALENINYSAEYSRSRSPAPVPAPIPPLPMPIPAPPPSESYFPPLPAPITNQSIPDIPTPTNSMHNIENIPMPTLSISEQMSILRALPLPLPLPIQPPPPIPQDSKNLNYMFPQMGGNNSNQNQYPPLPPEQPPQQQQQQQPSFRVFEQNFMTSILQASSLLMASASANNTLKIPPAPTADTALLGTSEQMSLLRALPIPTPTHLDTFKKPSSTLLPANGTGPEPDPPGPHWNARDQILFDQAETVSSGSDDEVPKLPAGILELISKEKQQSTASQKCQLLKELLPEVEETEFEVKVKVKTRKKSKKAGSSRKKKDRKNSKSSKRKPAASAGRERDRDDRKRKHRGQELERGNHKKRRRESGEIKSSDEEQRSANTKVKGQSSSMAEKNYYSDIDSSSLSSL